MRLNELEQRLCTRIAAQETSLFQQLCDHVAIPTGSGHTPGLDNYRAIMIERLEALGADVRLEPGDPRPDWLTYPRTHATDPSASPPTVIASRASGGDGPRILIAGHLDTVHDPRGSFQTVKHRPDDEGFAIGPGVVDMKGGVLIAITALEALAAEGVEINWTVLLNSDEETGSFHSAAALRDQATKHDYGIATEPALPDGSLAVERLGSGQFMIEVFGKSAHAGRAFADGVSAVNALAKILLDVAVLADADAGKIVNVGPIQGGTVTNAVPDYAACWGNVRFKTPEQGDELAAALEAFATDEDAMPRVVVHRAWSRPAKPLIPDVEALALRARQAAEDLGQSLPFASTGGVCDGNILQGAGLPTIDTLGVRGGDLHQPTEFIEIASLVERAQLMAVFLSRLGAPTAS